MPFLVFLSAALISIALIPVLMKGAARFGFIDMPGDRKVHAAPIPRIGGLAMVVGAMLPIIFWLSLSDTYIAVVSGVILITLFGLWDDRADLDYRIKFLGQFIAAIVTVVLGDVIIYQVPFGPAGGLPDFVAIPLSVCFIVGITNAINLADGLDGLAGGTALLSVAVISVLAYLSNDAGLLMLSLAVGGSIFGFLRFNTHPATIFMGDTGSQFLGFSLGVMTILLTQSANPALSPVLMILILGLPILDTFMVMAQRVIDGRSPFSPDKNHLHHKLLSCGFHHYEAVVSIYILQGLFAGCALFLRYEADALLFLIFILACLSVFLFIYISKRMHAYSSETNSSAYIPSLFRALRGSVSIRNNLFMFISACASVYLLGSTLLVREVPEDFSVLALMLFVMLASRLLFGYMLWFLYLRLIIYVTIAFTVYLIETYPPISRDSLLIFDYVFFSCLTLVAVIVIRYYMVNKFSANPMDLLLVLVVLVLGALPDYLKEGYHLVPVVIKLVVLFYSAEIILKQMATRWSLLPLSALAGLGVLVVRGYLI